MKQMNAPKTNQVKWQIGCKLRPRKGHVLDTVTLIHVSLWPLNTIPSRANSD